MYYVAGLDLAAGRGVSELVILRADDGSTPHYEHNEHRPVTTDEDIIEELARWRPRVIAIDAPLSLPRAVMVAVAPHLSTSGDEPHDSPYTRAAERDPYWAVLGIRPLPVSFLGGLTFRALALVSRIRASLPDIAVIETFPSATYRALGFTMPAERGQRRARKNTPTAREALQRQLTTIISGIPQPTDLLLGADTLDAIGAALASIAYVWGDYVAIGNASEGQIILPRTSPRVSPLGPRDHHP